MTNQIKLFAVGVVTPTEQEWSNHPPLSPFKGGGRSLKKIILVLKTCFKNKSSPACADGMAKAKGARGMKKMVINWVSCWGWSNQSSPLIPL